MSARIYKYVGPDYLGKVFASPDFTTLKCSYPKDFNDPYELFLTLSFKEEPRVLAYYKDVIGNLPQLPTTCFSRSPSVIPMWAHYADTLQGFVVEFEEGPLAEVFPGRGFGNVNYRDRPSRELGELLHRAYHLMKGRYVYMLQTGVFSTAYLTKAKCWSYEKERRMIVEDDQVRRDSGLMLLDVPNRCVTALYCGPRASVGTRNALMAVAGRLGCRYFDLKIGQTSATPYFLDEKGVSFVWTEHGIQPARKQCMSCKEPIASRRKHCSWCAINDSHRLDAAQRNIYRAYDRLGLLDGYIEGMQRIDKENGR